MAITLNTLVYNQDSYATPNRVVYVGPSNTFSVKDVLSLARTAPKPTATFAGVAKAEVKRTKTVTLSDGTKHDAILTGTCSLPVGMSKTDADALRADLGAALSGAVADALFWNGKLNQ